MHTAAAHPLPSISTLARAVRPGVALVTLGTSPDTGRPSFALERGGQRLGVVRFRQFQFSEGWQFVPAATGPRSRSRTLHTRLADCLRHGAGLDRLTAVDAALSNREAFFECGGDAEAVAA